MFPFNFSTLHLNVKTECSFEEKKDPVHRQVRQENLYSGLETEDFCKRKTFKKSCSSTQKRVASAHSIEQKPPQIGLSAIDRENDLLAFG